MNTYKKLQNHCAGLFTGLIEVWKDIENYEGIYQVSTHGNIKSLPRSRKGGHNSVVRVAGRHMKLSLGTVGYLDVVLSKDTVIKHSMVHRLVAKAFIENKENNLTVNHKDGNKLNNNISNLEWSTQQEQITHSIDKGLTNKAGKRYLDFKFKEAVRLYKHDTGCPLTELCVKFSIDRQTAKKILAGKDGHRIKKTDKVDIIIKRDQGVTVKSLSEEYGCAVSHVYRILEKRQEYS